MTGKALSPVVVAAAVIGLAAVNGGAFSGPARVGVGCALALLPVVLLGSRRALALQVDELAFLAVVLWGCTSALLVGAMPLRAKEMLAAWLATWFLWVLIRRGAPQARQAALLVLAGTGSILSVAVILDWLELRALRAGGLLENPNVCAAMLAPTLAVLAAQLRSLIRITCTSRATSPGHSDPGFLREILNVARLRLRSRARNHGHADRNLRREFAQFILIRLLRRNGPAAEPRASGSSSVLTGGTGRWLLLGGCGLLATGVLLTGSRAGLLAVIIAIAVVLPGRRLRLLAVAGGGVMAAGLVLWRLSVYPDPLAWHRSRIWLAVLQLVAENPITGVSPGALGVSAGPVRICYAERLGHHPFLITYAESTPLGLLVQLGVVGLLLLLAGLVLLVLRLRSQSRLSDPKVGAALAAMLIVSLFHDLLEVEVVLWWWAILLGAVVPVPPPARQAQRSRSVAATCALALCGVMLWGLVQPAVADLVWRQAPASIEHADSGLRLEPWYAAPARWRTAELLARSRWTWQDAAAAITWSQRAATAQPGRADGWSRLAEVRMRVISQLGASPDLIEQARQGLARACELEPHLPWYWLTWAQLERSQGQPGRARSLVTTAVTEEPACVAGWLLLARIELDLGRFEAARTAFRRAVAVREEARRQVLEPYEKELLQAPAWQWRELERFLQSPAQ